MNLGEREAHEGGPIQPLIRRFRETIELSPLNSDEIKELIELRLRHNRVEDKFEDTPLIPYDKTFVEYVNDLALGNPGEVVKYCDYALEEGIREKTKLLTKKFAKKTFIAHRLIPENEEE
jgi:type II secretory pathway predicted ATPase ExeA